MTEPALQHLPIDDLLPYARNAKLHPPEQIAQIAASIKEFGFNAPVLVDGEQGIIAGHGRVLAARKLGLATVPCIVLTHLTPAQKRAYIIADNRLGDTDLAPWDWEMLQAEIDQLKEENYDYTLTGFTDESLAAAVEAAAAEFRVDPEESGRDTEPQEDRAEELRVKWGVETGDLWHLGEHRLLCGDSTKAEDVARVMGGELADLCLTDPPYATGGISRDYDIDSSNLKQLVDCFLPLCFSYAKRTLLTPGNAHQFIYPKPTWVLAWFVQVGVGANPWGFTFWNAVFAYGKDPYLENGMGSRPDAFVKTEASEKVDHPTPKPIGVWEWLLNRGSINKGDLIYEPFSGSGTTIIACENLGRKCRAIEIAPKYVAVALQRWADHTGKAPVLA